MLSHSLRGLCGLKSWKRRLPTRKRRHSLRGLCGLKSYIMHSPHLIQWSQSARTVWIEILRMAVISPPMPVTVCEDCVHVADLNLVIFQLRSYQRKNVGVYELISYTSTFIIESSYQFESHKNRNPLRTLHHTSCLNITREAWAPPRWIRLWAVLIVTLLKPSLVFRFGKIKFFALEVIVTLRQ